jgi:[acyl-carrier-protein] S-malonyltransferase
MSKTALLFPGQASQYVGMARDLYEHSVEVRALYELASDEMKVDIARLSFDGPAEELTRTANTQPAILLHSLAALQLLGDQVGDYAFAAGHSLGEYSALAAIGAISFENAIRAVVRRAALMEEACQANPSTMAAIMGLTEEQLIEVCEKADGIVVPANFNSSAQLVISGENRAVEQAVELAKEAGAKRAVMLSVGGAFHSPLMEPARAGMAEFLAPLEINKPKVPVIANVTAEPVDDPEQIRRLLVQQIVAPVRWAQTTEYMRNAGVTRIIEIGPGKVLTGLAKRELRPDESINLDTLEDINSFASAMAG